VVKPTAPSTATITTSSGVTVRIDPKRNEKRSTLRAPAADTRTTPPAIPE
jgi:hypothetical protein